MSDINFLSAVEMADQIRAKRLSPVELVDSHFARIAQLNPKLNAFVALDEGRARLDASVLETEAAAGKIRGPLHGVPISVKSSLDTVGLCCEAGTRLRAGYVASRDAVLPFRRRQTHPTGRKRF